MSQIVPRPNHNIVTKEQRAKIRESYKNLPKDSSGIKVMNGEIKGLLRHWGISLSTLQRILKEK